MGRRPPPRPTATLVAVRGLADLPTLTVLPEVYAHAVRHLAPDHDGSRALVPAVRQAFAVLTDADLDGEAPPAPPPPAEAARMQREGDVWALTFGGRTVRVRRPQGARGPRRAARRAGEEVHCLELMGATDVGGSGTGPALDEQARREYQARTSTCSADVDEAHEANDPARAERAELELDALVTELSKAFGLGGRARSGGSSVSGPAPRSPSASERPSRRSPSSTRSSAPT